MHILEISNLQAILIIASLAVIVWLYIRWMPSLYSAPTEIYFPEEIRSYDHQIPKYFLIAGAAIVLGGFHTVLKSIPGFWGWLWQAGYGGHLFRDAANSHLIIMGGGTILLIGLTWYVLPRLTNRSLYSNTLATLSLWLIVAGVFASYVSWIILGLVEGNMVANGWEYAAAKEYLGLWHRFPTGFSSGIMGIGFWIYVYNVFATAGFAKRVPEKPLNYLTKFTLVTAMAYTIGTFQGIFQVIPDNAAWIDRAGRWGTYIDPVSHVHMNLVGGMMVSVVLFLIYFAPRLGIGAISQKSALRLFWLLVSAVAAFYLTFLASGLIVGNLLNGYGGLDAPGLAEALISYRNWIFGSVGLLLLVAFWAYFFTLWRRIRMPSIFNEIRQGRPKAFWFASSVLLVMGTLQGILQIIPGTAALLTLPEELPNIHAQMNMIGGILLALIGCVYVLLPELVDRPLDARYARQSLYGIGAGTFGYYLVTLVTGIQRSRFIRLGLSDARSAALLGWTAPALLLLTALPLAWGFLAFGRALWGMTETYRATWRSEIQQTAYRYNGPTSRVRRKYSNRYFLAIEAVFGFMGFPGLGWLFSGQAIVGVALIVVSPIILFVFIPIVISVNHVTDQFLGAPMHMMLYIGASTLLSVLSLWLTLALSRPKSKPGGHGESLITGE